MRLIVPLLGLSACSFSTQEGVLVRDIPYVAFEEPASDAKPIGEHSVEHCGRQSRMRASGDKVESVDGHALRDFFSTARLKGVRYLEDVHTIHHRTVLWLLHEDDTCVKVVGKAFK